MKKYVCTVCGYVYDEAAGDPENGIAPGTKWEDVPADYQCPLCGVGKDEFEEEQSNNQNRQKQIERFTFCRLQKKRIKYER